MGRVEMGEPGQHLENGPASPGVVEADRHQSEQVDGDQPVEVARHTVEIVLGEHVEQLRSSLQVTRLCETEREARVPVRPNPGRRRTDRPHRLDHVAETHTEIPLDGHRDRHVLERERRTGRVGGGADRVGVHLHRLVDAPFEHRQVGSPELFAATEPPQVGIGGLPGEKVDLGPRARQVAGIEVAQDPPFADPQPDLGVTDRVGHVFQPLQHDGPLRDLVGAPEPIETTQSRDRDQIRVTAALRHLLGLGQQLFAALPVVEPPHFETFLHRPVEGQDETDASPHRCIRRCFDGAGALHQVAPVLQQLPTRRRKGLHDLPGRPRAPVVAHQCLFRIDLRPVLLGVSTIVPTTVAVATSRSTRRIGWWATRGRKSIWTVR